MSIKFSNKQAEFLNKELSLGIEPGKEYDFDPQNLKKILEYCMDTEVDEAQESEESGKELSPRGEIAAELCDLLMPLAGHMLP